MSKSAVRELCNLRLCPISNNPNESLSKKDFVAELGCGFKSGAWFTMYAIGKSLTVMKSINSVPETAGSTQ
jgi:hypothetical protein